MKIAILGDTHLGARNASGHFSRHFNKFFTDLFYPYLIKNGITEVIQLGDMFDNRTSLSIKAYHACKAAWFDPLVENNIRMSMLLGNHDVHYKSTLKVNSPELLLGEYAGNIDIYTKPSILELGGTKFAMIPWICDENREDIFKFLNKDKVADICCGHFEISGFEMIRGVMGHGGMSPNIFDQFELTLSGHYHTKSINEYHRIHYVGTPYEITFADMHDPRGFHVFDTVTRSLEFIRNPYTMFERIIYNEGWSGEISELKGKAVKLVVEKKTDLYEFDRFVDSIKLAECYDLNIIENFDDLKRVDVDSDISIENSQTIINHYIDALDTAVDKEKLKTFMNGLYSESINA